MMRGSIRLLPLLGLLLAAGCNQSVTEEEVEVGYYGEAQYNHFLAAARFLDAMGLEARSVPTIGELPDEGLLLLPYEAANNSGMADQLSEWAWNGGHLVVPLGEMPSRAPWYRQDEVPNFLMIDDDDDEKPTPLLEEFGVETVEVGFFTNSDFEVRGELLEFKLPEAQSLTFRMEELPAGTYTDGDKWQSSILSMQHGVGRVTFLADPSPFINRYIGEADHARLLWRLTQLEDARSVTLVYGDGVTFLDLLLHHGWMPLLSLALLTVFWLMKNMPRFGPLTRPAPGAERQFDEHIQSSGAFLWAQDCGEELCAPLRNRITAKLARRQLGEVDDPVGRLVELTGLDHPSVNEAMTANDLSNSDVYTRVMRNLQTMDSSL